MSVSLVGVDVAKATLEVYLQASDKRLSVPNQTAGFEQFGKVLPADALVVMESTGGYHLDLASWLIEKEIRVAVVQPQRVRDFAKSIGAFAKTDAIDARIIVRFAAAVPLRELENIAENQVQLQALVLRRRQLVEHRKLELQHREAARSVIQKESINALVKVLDGLIQQIQTELATLLENDDQWNQLSKLLTSVPGIGTVTAATLIAELPELGQINREEIASLVGVAPFADDSGPRTGQRHIRGGRASLRKALYMVVVSALRCNPKIKAFAARLKAAGKPIKVIAVACMRKLLGILNTLVKTNTSWKPCHA